MTNTTYKIEHASSGKSKCQKCKDKIAKGELRIKAVTPQEGKDYDFQTYTHPKCFVIPPRALKGVTPEDFVEDYLEDHTADELLSDEDKKQQVIDDIAFKPPRASKGDAAATTAVGKKVAEIKAEMAKLPEDEDDEEEERPAKKAKSKGNQLELCARAMKVYSKMKNDDLKDVLRWNGQILAGTKDVMLLKCIDGHVNGRLGRCPSCFHGKLFISEEDAGASVTCKGYYDEEFSTRIPCSYNAPATSVPRLQPWYTVAPSEEETEAMKAITEEHKALADGGGGDVPQELIDSANKLDWPISDKKERAIAMMDLCTSGNTKVDLPQDEKKARLAVGKIIVHHEDATAAELLQLIVKQFGIVAAKEEAKEKQKSAIAVSCACAANAGIVQVFQELGDYYFKEGNTNAGVTYKKAIAAISGLDYPITAENAKGLGKGKTKVANIGKGSADKMYEYVTTGTMAKLEEKRMANA